ncbi:MAG: glycoside hydrolase family 32 protein [Candidatus Sumerlaeota bacterium]|nr:glycoside hydrolase family 32 protein [Candidatus Sumerlaeota bacterium]
MTQEQEAMEIPMWHFKPTDGYFGDPIPFFFEGVFHVFYLKAPTEPKRRGADFTTYEHIATRDFVNWTEYPTVIAPDEAGPDRTSCWTGSVFHHDGVFHLFYTGYNNSYVINGRNPQRDPNPQSICLATSRDMVRWSKHPGNPISLPPAGRFDFEHWRDPFVFRNPAKGCFMMSITAMVRNEGFFTAGALVMARSKDLAQWEVGEVYYNPGNHCFPECSDLFRMGDQWYLVTSVFDKTCYRMAPSLNGPWTTGRTDSFDGPLNYAMKTMGDDKRRIVLGWIRTKAGRRDNGGWEWAGLMSFPREIQRDNDGTLFVRLPAELNAVRGDEVFNLTDGKGSGRVTWGHTIGGEGKGIRFAPGQLYGEYALDSFHPEFDAEFEFMPDARTRSASLLIMAEAKAREADAPDHPGYQVAVNWHQRTLSVHKHGRRCGAYVFQDIDIETGTPACLRIIMERGLIEAFLNDKFALACPVYHTAPQTRLAFIVEEGGGLLSSLKIWKLAPAPAVKKAGADTFTPAPAMAGAV